MDAAVKEIIAINGKEPATIRTAPGKEQFERTWQWDQSNCFLLSALDVVFSIFIVFPEDFARNWKYHAKHNLKNWYIWSALYRVLLDRRYNITNPGRVRHLRALLAYEHGLEKFSYENETGGDGRQVLLTLLQLCPRRLLRICQQTVSKCDQVHINNTCEICNCGKEGRWKKKYYTTLPRNYLHKVEEFVHDAFLDGTTFPTKTKKEFIEIDEGEWKTMCKCTTQRILKCKHVSDRSSCLAFLTPSRSDYPDDACPSYDTDIAMHIQHDDARYELLISVFHPDNHYFSVGRDPRNLDFVFKCDPFSRGNNPTVQRLDRHCYKHYFENGRTPAQQWSKDILFLLYVNSDDLTASQDDEAVPPSALHFDPFCCTKYIQNAYSIWNKHNTKDTADVQFALSVAQRIVTLIQQ